MFVTTSSRKTSKNVTSVATAWASRLSPTSETASAKSGARDESPRSLRPSQRLHRSRVDAGLLQREQYRRRPVPGTEPDRVVAIVGAPRSGTSHLYNLLAHSGAFAYFTMYGHPQPPQSPPRAGRRTTRMVRKRGSRFGGVEAIGIVNQNRGVARFYIVGVRQPRFLVWLQVVVRGFYLQSFRSVAVRLLLLTATMTATGRHIVRRRSCCQVLRGMGVGAAQDVQVVAEHRGDLDLAAERLDVAGDHFDG